MNYKFNKTSKVIGILIILTLFFIPTIIAIKYVALSEIYSHFVNTVSNITGLNQYIIKAISALLFIPFLIGINNILSVNKKKRYTGTVILASLFIIYNLGLYSFTKDAYFSFSEGEVIKWYALTPEGVKFFDRPGVDPVYGIKLKPVTPEVIRNLKLLETGEFKPIDPQSAVFFNPITGESQVWYYQYPDGSFDFFDKPGYHHQTGEPLNPVSREIYFQWRNSINDSKKANKREKIPASEKKTYDKSSTNTYNSQVSQINNLINRNVTFSSNKKNVAIIIEASNSDYSVLVEQFWVSLLKSNKINFISNYLGHEFKSKGFFDRIYSGDGSLLKNSNVLSIIDYLYLFKEEHSVRKSSNISNNLISCDIRLSYKLFNKNGSLVSSNVFTAIGPGFSEDNALKRGLEIISENHMTEIINAIR